MIKPEKFYEPLWRTILRTSVTATILTVIFYFGDIFQEQEANKMRVFGIGWMSIMCLTFGGHWIELFFINYIKFLLPKKLYVMYGARIIFWYASALLLFFASQCVHNSLTGKNESAGNLWIFGFIYILIEMIMHGIIHVQIKKSFWNGVY